MNDYPDFCKGHIPNGEASILDEDLWHFMIVIGSGAAPHFHYPWNLQDLWQAGVWIDFVEVGRIASKDLGNYKVAILMQSSRIFKPTLMIL